MDVPCGGQTLIRQRPERETDVPEKEKKKKNKNRPRLIVKYEIVLRRAGIE